MEDELTLFVLDKEETAGFPCDGSRLDATDFEESLSFSTRGELPD